MILNIFGGHVVRRAFILGYAGVAYLIAMANIAYIVGFLLNVGVPKGINTGEASGFLSSIFWNISLVWLFGFQHSFTARTWFKRYWIRAVPEAAERATYLYMTAAMTWFLVSFWKPIPVVVWHIQSPFLWWGTIVTYFLVWVLMFSATFPIGHWDFFGLGQAWRCYKKKSSTSPEFTVRWLYAIVRHPISLGWMITPWIVPTMTIGQLCFAFAATSYVLVATIFEEADLTRELGQNYQNYKKSVPAFIPLPRNWR
jgi:protein-S-isoprenylcysteine O-methyltransferase Ste14